MKITFLRWACLVLALFALAGCKVKIDAPVTPTVMASPTLDETAVARLATGTPTPSITPTYTPTTTPSATVTRTSTATPSLTPTATGTATVLPTATSTPSATATATATATASPTATDTATATALPSLTPTLAPSRTPTAIPTFPPLPTATPVPTATASLTPTPPIAEMVVPTATPRATLTFTPFPSITPNLTATWDAQHPDLSQPTPTRTPGGIYTLAPTASPPPTITPGPGAAAVPTGSGTFYDPNAPGATGQESLPVAPAGQSGPSGPAMPEIGYIVISYAGQVVPLLPMPNGVGTGAPVAAGSVFAVSSSGQVAVVGGDRWLYVNNARMTVSPASQFGVPDNLSFGNLAWSPDGTRLAIRVDAANSNEQNAIDSGVWIYEPATNRSWQVFRNTYQAAQKDQERRALAIQWAPNGLALVVQVDTPLGPANVFMPFDHQANDVVRSIPYANASWSPDSTSLVVSGPTWNGPSVVGRIALDSVWTYTEYLNQQTTGLIMQDAAQLNDGRIAFLAGTDSNSFALYVIQPVPGAQPLRISNPVSGQVVSAEWNADRNAVLVTVQAGGTRRLWVIRVLQAGGTAVDTTPATGGIDSAHWR